MRIVPSAPPAASRHALPAATPSAARSRAAAGEAMRADWHALEAGDQLDVAHDEIALVVPLDEAVLRVGSGEDPRVREALAAPRVAILPCGGHSIAVERAGELLVARFDAARWSERPGTAPGHARELHDVFAGEDGFVRGIAHVIAARLREPGPRAPNWLDPFAEDLALHVATRHARPAESAIGGLAAHRLQRVLALIDERLSEPIQVRELAAAVNLSPYHFARMFRQSTGQPPHVYITSLRMDRAKLLLAQSALPLAQVATRVGYQTQAHFTGVFHARVGATPRAYRMRRSAR